MVEIDEGVGWPEMLAQLLARDHLASVLEEQNQNACRLLAQLDDGAIAAQFPSRGLQFENAEVPGPWRVDRHAHERTPLGWKNFTPSPIGRSIRTRTSNLFDGENPFISRGESAMSR